MINLNLYCSSPLATPNSKINCSESDVCLLLPCLLCCEVHSHSVVSNSFQPHELQHTRLLCPWGFSRQEYWSGLPCPPPELSILQMVLYICPSQSPNLSMLALILGFPGGLAGKESAYNAGDLGSIPGLGRSLRGGKDY